MQARTVSKAIGKVQIVELQGHLKGSSASRCHEEIQRALQGKNKYSLMFHAYALNAFDKTAAQILIHNAKNAEKSVLLTKDPFVVEELFNHDPDHQVTIFEKEDDAVIYLGKDLIEDTEPTERRLYPRLNLALPSYVHFLNPRGQKLCYFSIVTNLSPSGMFIVFLDHHSEIELRKNTNFYDLQRLTFSLKITGEQPTFLQGRVIHFNPGQSGFGIEFCDISETTQKQLQQFLSDQDSMQSSIS